MKSPPRLQSQDNKAVVEAINISYEAVPSEEWDERMERGEIAQNREKMLIYGGKRTDQLDPPVASAT